jgi:hypothetical protein
MYRFGHKQTDPRRQIAGSPDTGRIVVTPDKYHALIPNHCPAYISEEQYRRNQRRIRDNRFGRTSPGGARSGPSLLAGIVYCGRCGRRMTVAYSGEPAVMRYYCTTGAVDFRSDHPATSFCQNRSRSSPLEEPIFLLTSDASWLTGAKTSTLPPYHMPQDVLRRALTSKNAKARR